MQEHALERLLLPLSGLASWLIVLAGGLSLLHVLGINVAPLLTVGGVSGILVGLSAQSVMANMIAGINLVTSLPAAVILFASSARWHSPELMIAGSRKACFPKEQQMSLQIYTHIKLVLQHPKT